MCEFLVFARPVWVFSLLFFVPSEELMPVVFLEGLDILLGVDPFFVVGVFFGIVEGVPDVPRSRETIFAT